MYRANLTKPFWAASATLMLFIAGLLTSVLLLEECHTEQECNFDTPDAAQCPEGLECCENGICCQIADVQVINPRPLDPITPLQPRPCDVGETITNQCVCLAPNHEHKGVCTGPDPVPLACRNPIVQDTLRRLHQACDEHGSIAACPPAKIRTFAIDNKDTLLQLAGSQAPHSVTIHFQIGTPAPGRGLFWASGARQAEILASLRRHLDLSQSKGFMLMLVTNSDTGTDKINVPIARERAKAVHHLMGLLKADGNLLNVIPLEGLVATDMSISPQQFRNTWGADPGNGFPERFVGPSKGFEQTMRSHLARHGTDSRWLKYSITQSVVLIPIPCELEKLNV